MVGSKEAGVDWVMSLLDLVEGVAERQLGGDLGDREAGGLGCQGGGTAHARVHLDDDDAAGVGVHGELDVTAARVDAHAADDGDADVTQLLVFAIGQGEDGATVMESPVCTPTGSTFSIGQTTTTLSLRSRISSSSNSFQPSMPSSSNTSSVGE